MKDKIKLQIEINCWKDEKENWRYTSNDLGISNGFCNKRLIKKLKEAN